MAAYESDNMDEAILRLMNFCLQGLMAPSTTLRARKSAARKGASVFDLATCACRQARHSAAQDVTDAPALSTDCAESFD